MQIKRNIISTLKRTALVLSVILITLSCVGCAQNGKIDKSSMPSVSMEVMIAKDLYNNLIEFGSSGNNENSLFADGMPALTEYKVSKQIEGNVYYCGKIDIEECADYTALTSFLQGVKLLPEKSVFRNVTVSNKNNSDYAFNIKTAAMNFENFQKEISIDAIPSGSLIFSLTVSLPGEIADAYGSEGVALENIDDNTVQILICDLSESQSIFLTSHCSNTIILFAFSVVAVSVGILVVSLFRKSDKSKNE